MIRYSCPYCHRHLTSPDPQAGEFVKCPECGKKIEVPIPLPPAKPRKPVNRLVVLTCLIGISFTLAAIWIPYRIVTRWEVQRRTEEARWAQEQDYENYVEIERAVEKARLTGGYSTGKNLSRDAVQRATKMGTKEALTEVLADRSVLVHHKLSVLAAGVWSLVLSLWGIAAFALAVVLRRRRV